MSVDNVHFCFLSRSVIVSPYVFGDQMVFPFLTFTIQYPLVVAMLFLNFFADAKPKYVELEGEILRTITNQNHMYQIFRSS